MTITTTEVLAEFCARAHACSYVTVDTEFLRERTYYAKLCLIQLALPGDAPENAVLVDPIEGAGMSLEPLYELFRDAAVVKVFHAARQDLEIFYVEGGVIPKPLFDTQVAAMVCGFGEQVGYETLVRRVLKTDVDKSSRITDWSRRPLSEAQKRYALGDVTHLRGVYERLAGQLEKSGRASWVEEDLAVLTTPETYVVDPDEAWRRVKVRGASAKVLAVVCELARFRELRARERNVPRGRVFKDDALMELASARPLTLADLGRSRLLLREARKGELAEGILAAIARGVACPPADYPRPSARHERGEVNPGLADLLRVLVKVKSNAANVAQKLIATSADLDDIAAGDLGGRVFQGWREEVFGADARRLCHGELALACAGRKVRLIDLASENRRVASAP